MANIYMTALEKKFTEISGIPLDQIKKNQLANASSETKAIQEMADYVAGITIQKKGAAQSGNKVVDPQIAIIFKHIQNELGQLRGQHALPSLKYDYNGLEPHISGDILDVHHSKHHQGYVNNLNAAAKKLAEAEAVNDLAAINALVPAIKFNGGGHLNHTIYWTNLKPAGGSNKPSGPLGAAIDRDFGSFEDFKTKLSTASVGVKGSGWGWLGYCPQKKRLAVATCQDQETLQMTHGLIPLLTVDVWEHAYYLQYKNLRAAYVNAIFNIINWDNVGTRFEAAQTASA